MRRQIPFIAAAACVISLGSQRAESADKAEHQQPRHLAQISSHEVHQAIAGGLRYLREHQDPKTGTWPDLGGQIGGTTALATLAMLNCGVSANDPAVARSLEYLRTVKPATTYVTSLQTMVFCLADRTKGRALIERNVNWLEDNQIKTGLRAGSWAYPGKAIGGDNSNSEFAMLALYEAERVGVPVSDSTWRLSLGYWNSAQNADGSYGYFKMQGGEAPGSGSMTCAGVCSLAIAAGRATNADAEIDADKTNCRGNQADADSAESLNRALSWLAERFSVEENPQQASLHPIGAKFRHYYLFGLGRAGRLTGRQCVGNHDWYREGAAFLCNSAVQEADGRWHNDIGIEADPNIATSFALLFLGEGGRPVAVCKLQYGKDGDWNRHRHDVANLVHNVETKWRKEFPTGLAWQSIDIAGRTADDLRESPVLFICGSDAPAIDDKQAVVLREYLDRGGFIFAEACCNGEKFDRGFRELLKKMLPGEDELKPLPAEHRIWIAEQAIPADKRPQLLGIDRAGRTRIVYSPSREKDKPGLSCLWELSSPGAPKRSDTMAAQIETANAVGLNILSYATGRRLQTRDEFFGRKTGNE